MLYCQFDGGARGYAINTNPVLFLRGGMTEWMAFISDFFCLYISFLGDHLQVFLLSPIDLIRDQGKRKKKEKDEEKKEELKRSRSEGQM